MHTVPVHHIWTKKKDYTAIHITMVRIKLEQVSHTKSLGIVIDEQLDRTEHIKCCNKNLSSYALYSICIKICSRLCLSQQTSKLLTILLSTHT